MEKQEFATLAMAIRTYYPKENILPNKEAMQLWYSGTSEECSAQLGIKLQSFYKAAMKANRGEIKRYVILTDKEKDVESNNN